MRFATLQFRGRPDRLAVDRHTGALGAWLNGCDTLSDAPRENQIFVVKEYGGTNTNWIVYDTSNLCKRGPIYGQPVKEEDPLDAKFPSRLYGWAWTNGKICRYSGTNDEPGQLSCEGVTGIRCYKDQLYGREVTCKNTTHRFVLVCDW